MSQAIYRTYRPQVFADVTDQNHIKITVKNQIGSDTVAHAYLFAGPRGVGKTTLARLIAKAVNCETRKEGDSEPCNTCSSCIEMTAGRALDVIEIDAASHTGVDNVRENIIEAVRFAPGKGKKKVFIIDEVHMLSTSAFNALLKTLEEPPEYAIFILATTEIHKIPQTILSRCQRFDFHRIATPDIIARLQMILKGEGVKVAKEVLASIARLSEGCLRDAESLLGQILALGEKDISVEQASIILPITNTKTVVELVDALARKDVKSILVNLNNFVDQGGSVKNLTDEMIDFVRTMMFIALDGPYHDHYDAGTMEKIRQMNTMLTSVQSAELIDALLTARNRPAFDAMEHLPLELACVRFIGVEKRELKVESEKLKVESRERSESQSAPSENQKETPTLTPNSQILTPTSTVAPPVPKVTDQTFTVDELRGKWQRCCDAVAQKNVALPLALQKVNPTKIVDGEVELSFELQFHYETMKKPQNTKILADAINEVMQSSVTVKPIYAKEAEDEALSNLADAFGGKVVD